MTKLRGVDLDTSDWGPPPSLRRHGCLAGERSADAVSPREVSGVDAPMSHCPSLPPFTYFYPYQLPSDSRNTNIRKAFSIPPCPPEPNALNPETLQSVSQCPSHQISMFKLKEALEIA